MEIIPIKTIIFKENQNLIKFLIKFLPPLQEGDIIALSSKVSALSEGATAPISKKESLIKQESSYYKKTSLCYFTIRQNLICANAGIDESNACGKIVLLPKDPYKTANKLRQALCKYYKIKKLGIILTDSFILPLRAGVINIAVAYSGFVGVQNYCGKKDIFGRKLKMTLVNIADSLATSAGLTMGECAQKCPIALIRGAKVKFTSKTREGEMCYPFRDDFYYPFLKEVKK